MIEMLPCAIGSIPGVGSQGMLSGAAGEREPANVSPSPPGSPVSLTLKRSDCAENAGSVSRPTRRASFVPSGSAAASMQTTSAWNTCPCDPMSVSVPRTTPSLREPLRAKLPVDPAPRMSPPPTARMSTMVAEGGAIAGSTA
jgi:hypothetical protein